MYIAQQSVCFCLPEGTGPGAVSLVGQYRVAVVCDTSTGFVGRATGASLEIPPTYTLRVLALPTDVGVAAFYAGALQANPTASGPYPTGTGGTWCQASTVASYYTP